MALGSRSTKVTIPAEVPAGQTGAIPPTDQPKPRMPIMAEETKSPELAAAPVGAAQSVQVQVDVSKMETVYANFVRLSLSSSTEEVILDVGMHTGILTPAGMEPIALTHRLVMNPYVAKRLMDSLKQIVSRHESAFGALETDPQRRLRARQ